MNTKSSHLCCSPACCCRSSRFLSALLTLGLISILDSVTVQSFSPLPSSLKKKVGEMMVGLEGGGMERRSAWRCTTGTRLCSHPLPFLLHPSSPLPNLLCTFQHRTFQMIDWFVLNELLILRSNFWNRHSSHVRTQAHPSHCRSSHYVSHLFFFFFLTQQPSANFCFQDNHSISLLWFCHQGFCWWCEEVLKVLFFVSFVCDIGDEETVMIENWFLMRSLQTVHPGMH